MIYASELQVHGATGRPTQKYVIKSKSNRYNFTFPIYIDSFAFD